MEYSLHSGYKNLGSPLDVEYKVQKTQQHASAVLLHLTKQNREPSLCPFKSPAYHQNCSSAFKVAGKLNTPSIEHSSYKIQGNRRNIQHFIDFPSACASICTAWLADGNGDYATVS